MSIDRPAAPAHLKVKGARVGIVAARFNADIVDALLAGARAALKSYGIDGAQVEVLRVPGAWELPLAAAHLADKGRFDAIIALGAVVRGGTPHFEYVCQGCTQGLMQVQQEFGVPVAFGVLTCDTDAQARERAVPGEGNKGAEAALAALEMIDLQRELDV
jgi:6,7-dimethyl-8-ribityllumazine synthase